MKYVEVVFRTLTNPEGGNKRYGYKTELDLQVGSTYSIITDDKQTYDNVKVVKIAEWLPQPSTSTIVAAKLITSLGDTSLTLEEGKNLQNKPIIPRKPNPIRKVYFNKEKDTTVVLWKDGEKTILKRDSRDEWDYEKVVAMAFMKKYFNNRAYYYDRLQEIIEDAEIIGDEQVKGITFIGLHSVLGMKMYDLCREWVKEMKNPPIADLPPALRYVVEELDRLATLEQQEEMKRILSDELAQ